MKLRLPRFTPAARIALGLISLIVTLLLLADMALSLIPDKTDMQRKIRESTSERLAVQVTSLIQAQEWDALKLTISQTLARDREILSLAVRQQDGKIVVKAGNHLKHWVPPAAGKSTLTHVRVPIYARDTHWGDVEVSYIPVTPGTIREWLQTPLVALSLVIVPLGFLAFYLYMRRALQYLDPTAAIPDRVRVAFDALTEGVTIIDRSGRIMLHNKAFRQLHPHADDDMMGINLSHLPWLVGSGEAPDIPWQYAMQSMSNSNGHLFTITQPDQSVARVIVNAAPIKDARGKLRGCMVTFYDVTQLHRANEKMRDALADLEASREQVEKQNEELMRLATRDPLTGCLNRRAFYSAAEPLLETLREEARNMACIMCDIDHFKKVNDTHGHLVGDQVIAAVARALGLHLRNGDLLCRYGGEEFCIVLPGASEDAALDIAERLRREVEAHAGSSVRLGTALNITCSVGVSSLQSGAENLSELIELADFALYAAKRGGRNRSALWSEDLLPESPPLQTPAAPSRLAGY